MAAVGGEGRPQQALVLGEYPLVPIAQLPHQARRALDVREEERDDSGRRLFGNDAKG